jgi:hypothetical protein
MEDFVTVPDHELESHVNRESPAISEENFKTIEMMVKLRKMELSPLGSGPKTYSWGQAPRLSLKGQV